MRHKRVHSSATEPMNSFRSSSACSTTTPLHLKSNQRDVQVNHCLHCPMTFPDADALTLHLQNNHKIWNTALNEDENKTSSNACSKCNFVCTKRKTLIRHDKFVHGHKSNDNMCSICGRTFLKAFYLKSHIRTHQGIHPFRCSHCNTTFQHKYQLYKHLKRHKVKL